MVPTWETWPIVYKTAHWYARWMKVRTRVYAVSTEDGWVYKWEPIL